MGRDNMSVGVDGTDDDFDGVDDVAGDGMVTNSPFDHQPNLTTVGENRVPREDFRSPEFDHVLPGLLRPLVRSVQLDVMDAYMDDGQLPGERVNQKISDLRADLAARDILHVRMPTNAPVRIADNFTGNPFVDTDALKRFGGAMEEQPKLVSKPAERPVGFYFSEPGIAQLMDQYGLPREAFHPRQLEPEAPVSAEAEDEAEAGVRNLLDYPGLDKNTGLIMPKNDEDGEG